MRRLYRDTAVTSNGTAVIGLLKKMLVWGHWAGRMWKGPRIFVGGGDGAIISFFSFCSIVLSLQPALQPGRRLLPCSPEPPALASRLRIFMGSEREQGHLVG